jgi:hypothetical protein
MPFACEAIMAKPFSYDLGVFDPIFPGITLHYPNEAIWEHTQAAEAMVYSVWSRDVRVHDPKLTEADITPALVMERLLQNPDIGFALPAQERNRLGQSLIAHAPDDAVGYLAAASTFHHERRHFHDWLLSPYTTGITAIRAGVNLNYLWLRPYIFSAGTTVVPVPLPRWLHKTAIEQAELIKMWQGLLGDTVQVHVPDLSAPDVLSVIEDTERRYGSIGSPFQPITLPDFSELPGPNAAAVFEASAILIQTQAIHDIWGETASTLFAGEMTNPKNQTPYMYILPGMSRFVKPGEMLENKILLALVTWSLLGNMHADGANAHPLVRINHVCQYLEKCGFPPLGMSIGAIFTALDQECGVVPYQQLLLQSVQLGDTIFNGLSSEFSAPTTSKFQLAIVQAYGVLNDYHKYMVYNFLKDPDGYANPVDYLDRTLGIWPEPPVQLSFGKPFHRVTREQVSKYYQQAVFFDEPAGQDELFLRRAIRNYTESTPMKVDLQIADNWQFACSLADSVFAEFNRDHPEIDLQRDQLKKRGVYLMEVIT